MTIAKTAASAAALCLVLGVSAAYAAESAAAPATLTSCVDLAKKVKAALETAQQSPNLHDAQVLSSAGREFCSNRRYAEGVSRYSKALQILGAV
jgi:hypothetical protein